MNTRRLVRGAPLRNRLFYQIAFRQLVMTALFLLLEIAIVMVMYLNERDTLVDDLVSIQAQRIARYVHDGEGDTTPFLALHGVVRAYAVYDDAGRLLQKSQPAGHPLPAPDLSEPASLTTRVLGRQHFQVTGLRQLPLAGRQYWVALDIEGDGVDPLWPALLGELRDHALLPLIPLSVLLLLFNAAVVRRMLAPLQRAMEEVNTLDPNAMDRRLDLPESPVEVRTLVNAFNGALEKLDDTMQTLRRFTADAAHELRTPLATMMLTIERLPPSREKERLAQESAAMSRLLGQMLDLARADAPSAQPDSETDLHELAQGVAIDLAPLALRQGRQLSYRYEGRPRIIGNADAIARAIRNLVENALRHTPPATEVGIAVGPGPVLRVTDRGPGIPPRERKQVFDRFWRSGPNQGAGLGLSIVHSILKSCGGSITIKDAEGGGALVEMKFREAPRGQ